MQEGLRLSEQCLQCVSQRRGRPRLPPSMDPKVRYGVISVEEWRKPCFDFWADDNKVIILHITSSSLMAKVRFHIVSF